MLQSVRICHRCNASFVESAWTDGTLLMAFGAVLLVLNFTTQTLGFALVDSFFTALPCFVFGQEQRQLCRLCKQCRKDRSLG